MSIPDSVFTNKESEEEVKGILKFLKKIVFTKKTSEKLAETHRVEEW